MKLMIVESPGKTKKIQEFLGAGWRVEASIGHVRDLPEKSMGVEAPVFKPEYIATDRGAKVLARLAVAVKEAEDVYLATDPDREGEAIAWHIQDALGLKSPKRITFGEITEKAVKTAVGHPRPVDMNLVAAQEARRILDRFCGYMVSGPLSRVADKRLSAGRVQSPAVRLVVERERAIKAFTATTHYGVELIFEAVDNITDGWKAQWKPWIEEGQEYLLDKSAAGTVSRLRTLEVIDCQESELRAAPPAPFTTSSLQQAASNALKFSPKHTMSLAQKLYEGGHITYMRTDSPNLSGDFVVEARAYCESRGWPLVSSPRTWKSKEGAQEAHEAIRPTHIEVEEGGEIDDEKALYRMIRLRTLACLLEDAVYAVRVLSLQGDADGRTAEFEARGRTLISSGWKVVMETDHTADPDETPEMDNPVPAMTPGGKATAVEGKLQIKKTKPPKRFTEASLVKELEKRGIGRPSTYAAILDNILGRAYVRTEKRFLAPSPLGEAVVDTLMGQFDFIDFGFTKDMEDKLDDIAQGKANYLSTVSTVHQQLLREVEAMIRSSGLACPETDCSGVLYRNVKTPDAKDDRSWDFFSCPVCKNTFFSEGGKPGAKQEKREKKPQELSEFKCKARGCGRALIRRQGSKNGKGYDFFGCSGFPHCKVSYEVKDGKPDYDKAKEK